MIEQNIEWVKRIAYNLCRKNGFQVVDHEDLVQDGMLGLMDAATRYRPETNVPFTAFANRRVRGAMMDALRRQSWPRGIRKIRREINEKREKFLGEHGHQPSHDELAALLGFTEQQLTKYMGKIAALEVISTGQTDDEGNAASVAPDLFISVASPDIEDRLDQQKRRAQLYAAIEKLPGRERQLMLLYYWEDHTMKQIGHVLGVNEARVSQLHTRAVQRLRRLTVRKAA